MSGKRERGARWAWTGFGLAVTALLLLAAEPAHGARYSVAQCGWRIAQDADWGDSTGGAKFRPDSWCIAPDGADPFDGVHVKSLTRDGAETVSGTRLARWRWSAPAGTGITAVRGTWWHALHDGFEHRLGTGDGDGGFDVFAAASATDTGPTAFTAGFASPRPAFETRLLCARPEDRHCALERPSFSAVRALTLTLEDPARPQPSVGGPLLAGGWRRGAQQVDFAASDRGSGLRFAETIIDGARAALTEHPCAKAMVAGEWRATRMRPCETFRSGSHSVATTALSDGPHDLVHCAEDFAGGPACTQPSRFLVDNNAPAAPRSLSVAGGDGWRSVNDFDLAWVNPGQGPASPIAAASWRLTGPGFDSGIRTVTGAGVAAIADLQAPAAGEYRVEVWLRDEAGNEERANAASAALRFDDVAPSGFFRGRERGRPELLRVAVTDAHSGVAGGEIEFRRPGSDRWHDLPTALRRDDGGQLVARFPSEEVEPGRYRLRATVVDAAGNRSVTARYADGSAATVQSPLRRPTRLRAELRHGRGHGESLTVPFGRGATLRGRLTTAAGRGLPRRELRVVVTPAGGSAAPGRTLTARTGPHGAFGLDLGAGPSRSVEVRFGGAPALAPAGSARLRLRVRGGVSFRVGPRGVRTGQAVRMSGRVKARGTTIPWRGKLVAIQYLERETARWRPVLVTRTDRAGRFRAGYRFRYITRRARIRLRAAVLPEDGWPYAAGASRPAVVVVTGA
ncbi:MAG TPA: hypothetical protein VKA89_03015 [Solirubrobacterales bacterium]|nr:hypothetical protein [Solirubrobacterales bacterium]